MENVITKYQELENQFKKLYDSNCKELGFNSKREFQPNPVISFSAKFCLIALEPALRDESHQTNYSGNFKEPFINLLFMQSFNNLMIQYCAYKFLCNNHFYYQITDICKVPLTGSERKKMRKVIYPEWKKLLDKEIEILGATELIAIGYDTHSILTKYNYNLNIRVPHYSGANNGTLYKIKNEFLDSSVLKEDFDSKEYNSLVENVKMFVISKLLPQIKDNYVKLNKEFPSIDEVKLRNMFDLFKLEEKNKVRYYVYKTLFTDIARNNSK